jgi:hypothetical protein
MYQPVLGAFLSRDPLPADDGPVLMGGRYDGFDLQDDLDEIAIDERTNFYAYVGNSPINFVDPSGLKYGSARGRPAKSNCPPGCTAKEMNDIIAKLLVVQKETSVQLPWGWKNLIQHCENWEVLYEANLRKKYGVLFPDSPCVVSANVTYLTWWAFGGHAAYRVEFCDGTIIYIDNGTGGNGSGLFYPRDEGMLLHHSGPWWPKKPPKCPACNRK